MNINKLTLVKSVAAMAAKVATAPTPLYFKKPLTVRPGLLSLDL